MRPQIRAHFSDDMLRDLVARWGGCRSNCTLIGHSMNLAYAIFAKNRPLVLRITHHAQRPRDTVEAELQWIAHLARRGITVCRPVMSMNSTLLESCTGQGDHTFHAAAFERAPGLTVKRTDLTPEHLTALGRVIARLHAASHDYPQASRAAWDYNLDALHKLLLRHDAQAHDALAEVAHRIHALPRNRATFGLIHNDIHMSNYHVDGENIWLFDFDSCLYNWYLSDLACTWYFALAWMCGRDHDMWQRMYRPALRSLLDGYQHVHELPDGWAELLPLFLRFRALSLYGQLRARYGMEPDAQQLRKSVKLRHYAMAPMPPIVGG